MFAASRALSSRVHKTSIRLPRRTFFTETVQGLSNVFLDGAIAIPYPLGWPAYTTSIVLTGVLSRIVVFPFLYWSWKRERRLEEEVLPYLKAYHLKLKEKATQEIQKNPESQEFFTRAVREKLNQKRKELLKLHRCSPWATVAISSISQLPMFVLLSSTFLYISNEPGSVFRDEAAFTLQSLAHPDATAAIPVMTGLVSLATIETSHLFLRQERSHSREDPVNKSTGERRIAINPTRYIKSAIRILSLGRVILTFMMPGSVEVYWLTSAFCGLFTNWILNYKTSRRRLRLAQATKS